MWQVCYPYEIAESAKGENHIPQGLCASTEHLENEIHVAPMNDTTEHVHVRSKCTCFPIVRAFTDGVIIVTHNSFDNRESKE